METINAQHDTLFGGKVPAPTEDTLRNLQNYVLDRYCDIGIATDGDADRLGVIDDKGHYLHANTILVMLYYYLLKYKGWHGAAVRNIATTGAGGKKYFYHPCIRPCGGELWAEML